MSCRTSTTELHRVLKNKRDGKQFQDIIRHTSRKLLQVKLPVLNKGQMHKVTKGTTLCTASIKIKEAPHGAN